MGSELILSIRGHRISLEIDYKRLGGSLQLDEEERRCQIEVPYQQIHCTFQDL